MHIYERNHSDYVELLFKRTTSAASPGTVVAWGNNYWQQTDVPTGLSNVVAIGAGPFRSLALKSDGTVVGWGVNNYGMEYWETSFELVPPGLSGVTAIAVGLAHNLALKSDGTVVAWGNNDYGQSAVPADLTGVVAIAAGMWHSLALKSDGTVVAFGGDLYGLSTTPADLTGVTAIDAGYLHSLALKNDGTVVAWGEWAPSVPEGLNNVIAISAGEYHNLALKSDGTVVAWGNNDYGQSAVPTDLNGVVAIAAGMWHSLALKSDGTVVSWGGNPNEYGQFPVPADLIGVTSIAAGAYHSLALVDITAPTITITTPSLGGAYILGQQVLADYTCQDEAGGSGIASCTGTVDNGSAIDTQSVGTKSFTVDALDNGANAASLTQNYNVIYNFRGFLQPVDNTPTVNSVKAGSAIPVKFSLSGDQGLNILGSGPVSIPLSCDKSAPVDAVEQTVIATSQSGLKYDPATNTYIYVWKTDKTWAGTCRQLVLKLIDGTEKKAEFQFTK